eukprot:1622850-Alexandrium_andersonii.AAC.1
MRTRLGTELAKERELLLSLQPGQAPPPDATHGLAPSSSSSDAAGLAAAAVGATQPPGSEATAAPDVDATGAVGPRQAAPPPPPHDEVVVARLRAKIAYVFPQHNPQSRADLDWIMDQHRGREHELFKSVCDKYGVDTRQVPEPEEAA